ncbi:MAG: rRNA (Adenine-N(6)-)-methyltransferase [Parcubacteria group bacterium GW2011_GWA2_47_12]|nr:MAG: rRNA (Adenine-N(6)-)-methyltransferase [Parcubacteria group bacterium GW2011_GWA2_47_12]
MCYIVNIDMLSHSQNFLNNKDTVDKLLGFVDFSDADLVLEIGPGKGIITDKLIKKEKKVIAIEADQKLFDFLKKKYTVVSNIQLEKQDFLEYKLPKEPFIIVSNIPFNTTADIVRKITDGHSQIRAAYLIVQKEAAIKFLGAPYAHSPLLSHFLKINYEIQNLMDIPKSNYTPKPRFDTSLIIIKRKENPALDEIESVQFKDFMVYLFERRKPFIREALKSVMSNLQVKIVLSNLQITDNTEIKKIMFDDWISIFKIFSAHAPEKSKKIMLGSYQKLLVEQSHIKKIHRTRED